MDILPLLLVQKLVEVEVDHLVMVLLKMLHLIKEMMEETEFLFTILAPWVVVVVVAVVLRRRVLMLLQIHLELVELERHLILQDHL
tara:strand:+ start:46 stop:303 length:258 start_codon:yes stop_codon:yes gene_type:complete